MGVVEYSVSDCSDSWVLSRILDYCCDYCSGVD